jgi:hypothetical protein
MQLPRAHLARLRVQLIDGEQPRRESHLQSLCGRTHSTAASVQRHYCVPIAGGFPGEPRRDPFVATLKTDVAAVVLCAWAVMYI